VVASGTPEHEAFVGRRVLAQTVTGGHAEYAVADVAQVTEVPAGIPIDEAAALGLNYTTAAGLLELAGHGSVFFQGLSGGIGSALIDLIPSFPDLSLAGTAHPAHVNEIRSLGIPVYSYSHPPLIEEIKKEFPKGFDFVVDPFGMKKSKKLREITAPYGKMIGIGYNGTTMLGYILNLVGYALGGKLKDDRLFFSVAMTSRLDPGRIKRLQELIFRLYREGKLHPRIFATFSFSEIKKAHRAFETSGKWGKIILVAQEKDWQ
jgi:NADPH2:quinone reductase